MTLLALQNWNKTNDDRTKLQHVVLAAAFALVVVAGLVSLVNYDFGRFILRIAGVLFVIFIANGIIWALAQTFLFTKLKKPASSTTRR